MKPINRQEVVLSSYDGTIALVRVQEVEDRGVLKKNESGRALAVRVFKEPQHFLFASGLGTGLRRWWKDRNWRTWLVLAFSAGLILGFVLGHVLVH